MASEHAKHKFGGAVLLGDDVFDWKGLVLVLILVTLAVFASAAGALLNKGPEGVVP